MICPLDSVDSVSIFKSAICTHRSGMPPFGISDCYWLLYQLIIIGTLRLQIKLQIRSTAKPSKEDNIWKDQPFRDILKLSALFERFTCEPSLNFNPYYNAMASNFYT